MPRRRLSPETVMAYLALTGFIYTELFGFHDWTQAERRDILGSIRFIYTSYDEEGRAPEV